MPPASRASKSTVDGMGVFARYPVHGSLRRLLAQASLPVPRAINDQLVVTPGAALEIYEEGFGGFVSVHSA